MDGHQPKKDPKGGSLDLIPFPLRNYLRSIVAVGGDASNINELSVNTLPRPFDGWQASDSAEVRGKGMNDTHTLL